MTAKILGMRVDPTSFRGATELILAWAGGRESRYVCVANVHMVMEAYDNPSFREVVNGADLVTPDGMPLVWMLRRCGHETQTRVHGPELTLRVCREAAREGLPVGFYGGAPAVLESLTRTLRTRYPGLRVVYAYSPPFRALSAEEDDAVVQAINESGARVLFVGLGCPKQERWMAAHRG
ncbi:MAG: WecB/TagA/CpsF family glycosyltransferase, partial [Gammaproteobacteria bacterium]